MTIQAGSIEYTASIDVTSGKAQLQLLQKTTKKTGQEVINLDAKINKATESIKRSFQDKFAKAAEEIESLNKKASRLQDRLNRLGKTSKESGEKVKKSSRNYGQAGIQFQQLTGQIQGGQSAMVALSQQAADLGIVLGAPLIGVFGSLGFALSDIVFNVGKAETSSQKLSKAIEHVKVVMTLGSEGVANYSDQMKELDKVNKEVAKMVLGSAIKDQTTIIKEQVNETVQIFNKLNDGNIFFNFNDAIKRSDQLFKSFNGSVGEYSKFIGKQLGFVGENAKLMGAKYIRAFADMQKANTVEGFNKQLKIMRSLETTTGRVRMEMQKYIDAKNIQIPVLLKSVQELEALNKTQKENANLSQKSEQIITEVTKSLIAQNIELTGGKRALLAYSMAVDGYTQKQIESNLAIYDANKAIEDNNKKLEEREKQLSRVSDELDRYFEAESQQDELKDQRRTMTVESQVKSIGLDPLEEIEKRYKSQSDLLKEAVERDLLTKQDAAKKEEVINKQKVDAIKQYEDQQRQNQKMLSQSTQDTLGALGNAFGNFAEIASRGGKKSFENYKKMASAQAMISTFLAANNALATPAPFPIPQILAGSIAALGMANVAQINNQQYAGAREFGGPVTNGKSYLVGERGPEIFTPGSSGGITSNKDMQGGMGEVTIIMNNLPASVGQPTVTIDQVDRRIEMSFNKMNNDIASRKGNTFKAIRNSGSASS